MRYWLPATATVALISIVGGGGVFAALAWPNDWEPAAQATLAGAFATAAGAGLAVFVKVAFDWVSLDTQHRLGVRAKILDSFYMYAGHYLMPLAGAASALQLHLITYQAAQSAKARRKALDGTFYSLGQYVRIQAALLGRVTFAGVDRPLGLFLKSSDREDRVWHVMMPSWVFGIRWLEEESILIDSMTESQRSPVGTSPPPMSPAVYIANSHDAGHPLFALRKKFDRKIREHKYLTQMIEVLTTLNKLINYEVRSVLNAWYTDVESDPPPEYEKVKSYSNEIKDQLGIFYISGRTAGGGTLGVLDDAESPAGASGPSSARHYTAPIAAAVAAAVIAVVAGGWYARRLLRY